MNELIISKLLRYGVTLSALILGLGLFLYLVKGAGPEGLDKLPALMKGEVVRELEPPRTRTSLLEGLHNLRPDAVISLGLLVLILLPIARVFLTSLLFFFEKDFIFSGVSLLVLAILLYGLKFGKNF